RWAGGLDRPLGWSAVSAHQVSSGGGDQDPTGSVAALLVSHDGARWLPTVLEGLAAQTRLPDLLVAVDTGSRDDSVALIEASGITSVVREKLNTTFPEAVRAGL